jgi:hypothetical protein
MFEYNNNLFHEEVELILNLEKFRICLVVCKLNT